MKLKALLGALVIGVLGAVVFAGSVSAATTSQALQGSKPACVPDVTVVLTGKAAAAGGATTLSVTVTGGNRFARTLFHNNTTTTLTVQTNTKTLVTVSGKPSALISVKQGDHVVVKYRVCQSAVSGKSPHLASASAFSTYLAGLIARDVIATG